LVRAESVFEGVGERVDRVGLDTPLSTNAASSAIARTSSAERARREAGVS